MGPAHYDPSCPNDSTFMNSAKRDKNNEDSESADDPDLFPDTDSIASISAVGSPKNTSAGGGWLNSTTTSIEQEPPTTPAANSTCGGWSGGQAISAGGWSKNTSTGRSPASVAEFRNSSPSSMEYRSPAKYKGKKCAPKGAIRSKNDIVVVRSCEDEFMLRCLFDGSLHILEIPVSSKSPNLEKTFFELGLSIALVEHSSANNKLCKTLKLDPPRLPDVHPDGLYYLKWTWSMINETGEGVPRQSRSSEARTCPLDVCLLVRGGHCL